MNKKASSIILILFEIIVVMIVVGGVTELTYGYAHSDTVLKTNAANDLAMMINALVGVPGDAEVEYPANMSKYSVLLDSHSVMVLKKGDPSGKNVIRTFNLPQGYRAEGVAEELSRICLEKSSVTIRVGPCPEEKR
jgi:hypothetical protein